MNVMNERLGRREDGPRFVTAATAQLLMRQMQAQGAPTWKERRAQENGRSRSAKPAQLGGRRRRKVSLGAMQAAGRDIISGEVWLIRAPRGRKDKWIVRMMRQ